MLDFLQCEINIDLLLIYLIVDGIKQEYKNNLSLIIISYIPQITYLINSENITLLTELICFFRVWLKYASYMSRRGLKS